MQILVVSDLHLTSTNFTKSKAKFLFELFSKYDQIIINGDLWCNFSCTFDDFINSEWNALFPLLKKKNTLYIEGNHDLLEFCDSRVYQFCTKHLKEYSFSLGNRRYLITHGHQYSFDKVKSHWNILVRRKYGIERFPLMFQGFFIKLLTYSLYSKITGGVVNARQFKKSCEDLDTTYIMGHTHSFHYDKNSNYINLGLVNYGVATYLVIDENSHCMHYERY